MRIGGLITPTWDESDLVMIGRPAKVPFLAGRTDIAAAYSMRRLSAAYTGPVLRARRASDNAEQDFSPASSFLTFSEVNTWAGGNAFATTFYDQSGGGRNLLQATTANQPQIINAANSLPALLFDGSNDVLATGAFARTQPYAFNSVHRVVAAGSTYVLFDGLVNDTGQVYGSTGADTAVVYAGAGGVGLGTSTSIPIATRGAIGGTINGASSLLEVNAATIASFSGNAGASNASGLTLGGRASTLLANMESQEFILFSTAHTQAQLQADNASMRAAWGF